MFTIKNSAFTNNSAKYGGGVYLLAFHSRNEVVQTNRLIFANCNWTENSARYSSAVDISPSRFCYFKNGILPVPEFHNCNFVRNKNIVYNGKLVTSGVFVLTQMTAIFSGLLVFDGNAYSAVLLNSARIEFAPNVDVTFFNNIGYYGGAIALHGFSSLSLSNNSIIRFLNNTATEYGGAIYYRTTEQREFLASRSCFIEYNGTKITPVADRNITITFSGNSAKQSGSSIFASTFFSCFYTSNIYSEGIRVQNFVDSIGNITLDTHTNDTVHPLGTLIQYIIQDYANNGMLVTWPGKSCNLPLIAIDEQNCSIRSEFFTRIGEGNSTISLKYPFTVDGAVTLFGFEGSKASLIASTQNQYRIVQYALDVKLTNCPPGFYFDDSSKSCNCSATSDDQVFHGITMCNDIAASVKGGFWAGYHKDTFYIGRCPLFCSNLKDYYLPESNNSTELNSRVCKENRSGVLCGECESGFSVYYHSRQFKCGKKTNVPTVFFCIFFQSFCLF